MCVLRYLMVFALLCSVALGFLTDHDRRAAGNSAEHYFRHQQHYNQRAEHAADDLRASQKHHAINASHLVVLRHRHYEHPPSLEEDEEPTRSTSAPPTTMRRHHLRHYNRHHQSWEQRVFPALRHQATTTTTSSPPTSPPPGQSKGSLKSRNLHSRREHFNLSAAMQSRLFDRDGLYSSGLRTRHGFIFSREPQPIHSLKEHDARRNHLTERLLRSRKISEENYEDRDDSNDNDDDYYDDDEDDDGNLGDGEDEDDRDAEEEDEDDDEELDSERSQFGSSYNSEVEENIDENENRIDNLKILPAKLRTNNIVDQTSNVFSQPYIPGTMTSHKHETLGTHEAVKQSRKNYITNHRHHLAQANTHINKIHFEASCRWPKPKVEKIQKDPSKKYFPHCTVLHRCGDDTGCCEDDLKTCVAMRTQAVDLYFTVHLLGSNRPTIERHTFINHTECHCVNKSKHVTNMQSSPALLKRATILDCNCPRPFEKVLQDDGECRCDCSSGNTGCDWLKRGMEHFSMSDRKCILEGRCKHPTCEYGLYNKNHGRCPRKESRSFH
ncbi:unnamed protein product [Hermetia illucens]|uniref:Platelet-derived growth factor (PDGF) family profile domain-containing protein n=2 Tax=Hermetia illucens TaxID=343691 RepID=A0A7R8UEV8_HERIL|nr:unnamed protein product [Hermetia illucens]